MSETTTRRRMPDDDPKRGADDLTSPPDGAGADTTDREQPGFSHGGTGEVPQPRGGAARPPEELQDA